MSALDLSGPIPDAFRREYVHNKSTAQSLFLDGFGRIGRIFRDINASRARLCAGKGFPETGRIRPAEPLLRPTRPRATCADSPETRLDHSGRKRSSP